MGIVMIVGTALWGITCLIAAVGCVLVFRAEDRSTIASLRRRLLLKEQQLVWQRRDNEALRSRLSQLMPIDTVVDRISEHERSKINEVYDQTKDRGPTRRVRTW